jgi:hypothetical protein
LVENTNLAEPVSNDVYSLKSPATKKDRTKEVVILKNQNYVSYQPIIDKIEFNKSKLEKELPASEEYQVAIRGNNKLLIQDQFGDGEQIIITLKNQYDSGITIIHNNEKGQIRIRDHLGQGVLIEANENMSRVTSWTKARQIIEQGTTENGAYTYVRNGDAWGNAFTDYGTKTNTSLDELDNQELLLVNSQEVLGDLTSKVSSKLHSFASQQVNPSIILMNSNSEFYQALSAAGNEQSKTLILEQKQGNLVSTHKQTIDGDVVSSEKSIINNDNLHKEDINIDGGSLTANVTSVFGGNSITTTDIVTDASVNRTTTAGSTKVELDGVDSSIILTTNNSVITQSEGSTSINSQVPIQVTSNNQSIQLDAGSGDVEIVGNIIKLSSTTNILEATTNNITGDVNNISGATNFSQKS